MEKVVRRVAEKIAGSVNGNEELKVDDECFSVFDEIFQVALLHLGRLPPLV